MRKTLQLDVTRSIGAIRPLHGIDNGPVSFSSLIDCTPLYQTAGFPFIRLHDTNYPHPREVDVPQLFPDFDADVDDPRSYRFRRTDEYLRQCLDTGAKIIYRLGTSIEHTKVKDFAHPPDDFAKWARICLNIIHHYNEGWADGFHWNIEYWEIWNEPDNQFYQKDRSKDPLWCGTPEQYYDLYAVTSRMLKKAFPHLKIGGYGTSRLNETYQPFFQGFLDRVQRDQLPLDFFSWHRYATDPEDVYKEGLLAEAGLDRIGYTDTESICDEWNYWPAPQPEMPRPLAEGTRGASLHSMFPFASGHAGTSFCVGTMARLHDTRCGIATHYDGVPTNYFCSIFDRYGYPEKQYYAFVMYRELYERQRRVPVEGAGDGIYALAAGNADSISILVTSFRAAADMHLLITGLDTDARYRQRRYLTDAAHCHTLTEEAPTAITANGLYFQLGEKGSVLILLDRV